MVLGALVALTTILVPDAGAATPGAITTFNDHAGLVRNPNSLATGPDGALWFTSGFIPGNSRVGRITTAGAITAGPDDAMWYGGFNQLGRVAPDLTITTFPQPIGAVSGLVVGPDGALWFSNIDDGTIGRMTTSGAVSTYSDPNLGAVSALTLGPDDALWALGTGSNRVGRISMTGAITTFASGSPSLGYGSITQADDDAIWFTNPNNSTINRVTAAGVVTQFDDPSGNLGQVEAITSGPDGSIWFTSATADWIGRMILPPGEPVITDVASSGTTATVRWTVGPGGPVSGYTASASPGGANCSVSNPPLMCTITGLAPGTTYTFSVSVTGAGGTSTSAAVSTSLQPTAPPLPSTGPTTDTGRHIAATGPRPGTPLVALLGGVMVLVGGSALRLSRPCVLEAAQRAGW